jgi:DNA-binding GntR family transcriptional regulator
MIDLHRSAVDAIRAGDVETLEALLLEHPSLTKARPDRARTSRRTARRSPAARR